MRQNLPSQEFKSDCVLDIPGRIRVKNNILINNKSLCDKLISSLSDIAGVILASANCYTGKVLVIYDVNQMPAVEVKERIDSIIYPKNIGISKAKVVKVDFQRRKPLNAKKFKENKKVLSNDYYQYNLRELSGGIGNSTYGSWCYIDSVKDVVTRLNADVTQGLSAQEAEKRLTEYGKNQFEEKKRKSLLSMFVHQFDGFIIKLLLGATGISWLLGQAVDAAIILGIIGLEAILGVWQERKAEKSLDALKELSAPNAYVLRGGIEMKVSANQVVPGDILILEAGDHIAADARLIESYNMEAVEASLTGEAYPVYKNAEHSLKGNTPLGDRSNMVYMGTSIVRGKGKAVVVATGMRTEMGRIAGLLNNAEQEKTPLQKDLDKLAKFIACGCLGICGVITIGGIIVGHPVIEMLRTGISLAVGAIPEGLTSVLTIALAFGVQRMAKKNAIVKTLPAVETLSCTGVICTDKTGTLTKNEMTVKEIFGLDKHIQITGEGYNTEGQFYLNDKVVNVEEHGQLKLLLIASALCNNASIKKKDQRNYEIKGDPTEAAMLVAAEKAGICLESFDCYQREHEIPFDSETKKMTTVCHDEQGEYYAYTKGAINSVITRCNRIMSGNAVIEISDEKIQEIMKANEEMASRALRVLSVAYKPLGKKAGESINEIENDMVFLGLIGMMDPPRAEVKEAIGKCHKAGIKVVMVTGDHKKTAEAIAASINLLTEKGIVLSGEELDNMSEDELSNIIDDVQVFARTCPEQKLKIVKAFKNKGYVVAMTGDGVNDAPAVKEAHIGIAMGKSGADVTRESSSIILMDDNFETIVKAVEEGRTINKNVRKFMKYVLAGNFAEVLAIFFASVSGFPVPLVPGQILMINLVTEGIPALALGIDPPGKDVMAEPPRDGNASVFTQKVKRGIITRGIACGLTTLGVFGETLLMTGNLAKARTMAFANLISCQMLHAYECSSKDVIANKYLVPSIVISAGIMIASIYLPTISGLLGMFPLNIMDWLFILLSTTVLSRLDDFIKNFLYVTKLREKPAVAF